MKPFTISKLFFLAFIFFIACRKNEPTVITKACISANKYCIKTGDTIVFTNCSQADYAEIGFKRKNQKLLFLGTDKILSGAHFIKTFSDTGIFLAIVNSYMNKGKYTMDIDSSLAVTVHP